MRPLIDKYLVLVILSVPAIQNAFAIDLQPGDVVAPKPGFSSMQVSYQYAERNDYYVHGKKVAAYPEISSSIYALRLGHSFEVAQLPAYFYAQVPFGAVHPQGGSVVIVDWVIRAWLLLFGRMPIVKQKPILVWLDI